MVGAGSTLLVEKGKEVLFAGSENILSPGGNRILMAAGGPIEPFWSMYAVHKTSPEVAKLLVPMKIGTLKKADQVGAWRHRPNLSHRIGVISPLSRTEIGEKSAASSS
jgi:hypothetical protein